MVLLQEARQSNKSIRCLVLGLDNAGKSSVVAKFFATDGDDVAPTVGFEIKTRRIGDLLVDFWDVGGQTSLRPFWSNYFHTADALIWVVDSADRERLNLCADELSRVLKEERLVGAPVLILANKQDMRNAAPPEVIEKVLDLEGIARYRQIFVRGCSAKNDPIEKIRGELLGILNASRRLLFPETAVLSMEDLNGQSRSPTEKAGRCAHQVDWNSVDSKCADWNIDVSHLRQLLFRSHEDQTEEICELLENVIQELEAS